MLYGTSSQGGAYGGGTVFSISTSGKERVLYSFGGSTGDGAFPEAEMINVEGTLYGTTLKGGAVGQGTVFAVTRSGKETLLHSFGGSGDGTEPMAGLINVNDALYGTTSGGGTQYAGTAFAITPQGKETVLHSFGASGDGQGPFAGLINANGTLYGTTSGGGKFGGGTVFAITTSGNESVVYSFGDDYLKKDGTYPAARLIKVGTKLYGTTYEGGVENNGTVFATTMRGNETVLHIFGGEGYDGANPQAGLINVGGVLYGTTYKGGVGNYCNCGTVFAITP